MPSSTPSISTVSASIVAVILAKVPIAQQLGLNLVGADAGGFGKAADRGGQLQNDLALARRGGAAFVGALEAREIAALRDDRFVVFARSRLADRSGGAFANELPGFAATEGGGEIVDSEVIFRRSAAACAAARAFAAGFFRGNERRHCGAAGTAAAGRTRRRFRLPLLLVFAKVL